MKKKVIFILGTGHCGSTLLDLILGSHSNMFSLGEVYRIISSNPPIPICDICEEDCEFWTPELLSKIRASYSNSSLNRISRKLGVMEAKEVSFYRLLFKASKKNILIDSTKKPSWINRNRSKLELSNIQPILVYLSRDGRAVVNSYFRKYPQRGLDKIANNWIKRIKKINSCYDAWEGEGKIHIRYEDLAKNPIQTIEKLTLFLKLPFEKEMMMFWSCSHHLVNGNAGTKSMLLKFRDNERYEVWVDEKGKEYYKNRELGIKFDERWRSELNIEQTSIINGIIGNLNSDLKEEDA